MSDAQPTTNPKYVKVAASLRDWHARAAVLRNAQRINQETGTVLLSRGQVCTIDLADIPLIQPFTWIAIHNRGRWYAYSTCRSSRKRVFMHVLLMGTRDRFRVDHVDGNGLNNRRENLRWATATQNQANKKHQCNSRSPYKGVWHPTKNHPHWRAAVMCNGIRHFLGVFGTAEEAARAYDHKALELFGEFAKLNFPGDTDGG